jgi:hypothetical protein
LSNFSGEIANGTLWACVTYQTHIAATCQNIWARKHTAGWMTQKLENADTKIHESVESKFAVWDMWTSNYMT